MVAKFDVNQVAHKGVGVPHFGNDMYNREKLFIDQMILDTESTCFQEANIDMVGKDLEDGDGV